MADTKTSVGHAPIWLDLSAGDPDRERAFYANVFGWNIEVNPDPQYGGYSLAKLGGKDVAGIGPKQDPNGPTAWMVYVGTSDADETAKKTQSAGGKVVVEPMQVGPQGRMVVIQDPSGAFLGIWEPGQMKGAGVMRQDNAFSWAELNSRGIDNATAFYSKVFGWTVKSNDMGPDTPPYLEFQVKGESVGGGMEMNPMVPKEVPSYWMPYFGAKDVDKAHERAKAAGAREMVPPQDFPGGRFSILSDPEGAAFGIMSTDQ
jgi:predicted enzyme related to lactoylglutathione lyase